MPYDDDFDDEDDLGEDDLADVDDDDLEPDTSASARRILADLEAAKQAARNAPPEDPGMGADEFLDATQELLDLVQQDLASDDPARVKRANAAMDRFEAMKRKLNRNRPGRIA